jgi:hypothetical protein
MLARHLYEVIDPDAADAEEGRRLEREEHAAARATYLHLCDNGDGTHTGRFKIPTLHAQMLAKALHALTAPTHTRTRTAAGAEADAGSGAGAGAGVGAGSASAQAPTRAPGAGPFSRPERLGHALCELLERYPADRLPKAGGVSATVLVLLDYDKLLSGLGAAHLDTGCRSPRARPAGSPAAPASSPSSTAKPSTGPR